MDSAIEYFACDQWIRQIYYHKTEDGDQGICEPCRKKHIYDNPMRMLQMYLGVKTKMLCIKYDLEAEGDKKTALKYEKGIQQIEKLEKELQKLPEIQKQYRKNNPAGYKKPIKDDCKYCGANKGQLWINNPNGESTEDTCWWICKPCKKVIELQKRLSQLDMLKDMIEKRSGDTTKINKDLEKINKEINDITYEDGQNVLSIKITKKEIT